MNFGATRTCGILLHPTSLPDQGGIGTLGKHAFAFVDWLKTAGQSLWQVLPLGPTGYGDSPYACLSTFAGNPLMIDLEMLARDEVVDFASLPLAPLSGDHADFSAVIAFKNAALDQAAERFGGHAPVQRKRQFDEFCNSQAHWLDDFALFMAIKAEQGERAFVDWDTGLKLRRTAPITHARTRLASAIRACQLRQFYFFNQWEQLRTYAHECGVKILGDLPIFVAFDSADVWASPHLFRLDQDLQPRKVAGVPPDYFSATGQLWGNPVYDWLAHEDSGFAWWIARLRHTLSLVDIVRLDHFRGFEAAWEIPAGEPTAVNGEWVPGPGRALFDRAREVLGVLPIVAEDLGLITPEVVALREQCQFPGMHVLHFGFGLHDDRIYGPHRAVPHSVAYTGTHDNDTTVGWFAGLSAEEKGFVAKYLATDCSEIHWSLVRAAYGTSARTAIVPVQDILGLDTSARMNMPGQMGKSWTFRLRELPDAGVAARLHELAVLFERLPGTIAT